MLCNQLILALGLLGLGSSSVSAGRGSDVKRFLDHYMRQNPGKNVFIYHANHGKFSYEVSHLVKQEGFEVRDGAATEYFNTLIFEGWGRLQNYGDGGYENWAIGGNCHKDGKVATCW